MQLRVGLYVHTTATTNYTVQALRPNVHCSRLKATPPLTRLLTALTVPPIHRSLSCQEQQSTSRRGQRRGVRVRFAVAFPSEPRPGGYKRDFFHEYADVKFVQACLLVGAGVNSVTTTMQHKSQPSPPRSAFVIYLTVRRYSYSIFFDNFASSLISLPHRGPGYGPCIVQ